MVIGLSTWRLMGMGMLSLDIQDLPFVDVPPLAMTY